MLARIKTWLAAIGFAVALIAGAYASGRINGKAARKAEAHKEAAETLRKARQIENESNALPIDVVRERIAGRMRD